MLIHALDIQTRKKTLFSLNILALPTTADNDAVLRGSMCLEHPGNHVEGTID
jgi:hypothetical protein